MSASEVTSLLALASTAIADASWSAADTYVLRAEALLAGIPDSSTEGASIRYQREAIAALRRAINARRATATGLGLTKIKHIAPTDDD